MSKVRLCRTCAWFQETQTREENGTDGECRVNPPVPIVATGGGDVEFLHGVGVFPEVFKDSWCRRWKERAA